MPAGPPEAAPIVGILLAAGKSRRFGADKRWHPLADGTPMALAAALRLCAAVPSTVAVVRPEDDDLADQLAAAGCRIVRCDEAAAGMGHSLATGVRATPRAAGWLIALADLPAIRPDSYRAVLAALQAGAPIARPAYRGRPGHPVGFSAEWGDALAALTGDAGARAVVAAAGARCATIAVDDPGVVADIDTPDEIHRAA